MLGAADKYTGIDNADYEWRIKELFGKKGQEIVELNIKAFYNK